MGLRQPQLTNKSSTPPPRQSAEIITNLIQGIFQGIDDLDTKKPQETIVPWGLQCALVPVPSEYLNYSLPLTSTNPREP